jgi:hypothetical protein
VTGGQAPSEDVVQVCKATLSCLLEAEGDPPSRHAVELSAHSRGLSRPDEAVLDACELRYLYLFFESQSTGSARLSIPVAGHFLANPHDRLLHHYFIPVLRSLVDRPSREELLSATETRRVTVFANEMEQLRGASPVEMKVVGRLLDVEKIGLVEWFGDPSCPWRIEINFDIREYANVGTILDFIEHSRWKSL